MIRIIKSTGALARIPLPAFLTGLAIASLADLAWTDPALGVQAYGWLPEENGDAPINISAQKYGAETLTLDAKRNVVMVTHAVVALTAAEVAAILAAAQAAQLALINTACEAALLPIVAPYPVSERLTWDQQLSEAVAYTASSTAVTPILSAIATASGQTVTALAASVIAKSTAYKAASGAVIGKRQTLAAQIAAATTVAAVQAVVW